MNEIYWHDKRSLSSKQISSPPPPTQPRRAYESSSTHRTQTDVHMTTNRTPSSSYTPYSSERQSNFPYTSSLYGVYRQTTPSIVTSPVPLHPSSNRYQPQQRQISRSLKIIIRENIKILMGSIMMEFIPMMMKKQVRLGILITPSVK